MLTLWKLHETEEHVEGLTNEVKIIKKRLSSNKDVLFSKIEDLSGATLENFVIYEGKMKDLKDWVVNEVKLLKEANHKDEKRTKVAYTRASPW